MATILIIDDNDTIREGLAHTVKKLGHAPVTAASGTAGIDAFKQKRADFVITDLKMDGATGVDVLRAIGAIDQLRVWNVARTAQQICTAAGKVTCP